MSNWKSLTKQQKFVLLVACAAEKVQKHGNGSFTLDDVMKASSNVNFETLLDEDLEIIRETMVKDKGYCHKFLIGNLKMGM